MRRLVDALAVAGLVSSASLAARQFCAPRPAPPRMLQPGDSAPDFELQGTDGRVHRLSDYRGKQAVVLAWFARAFSAG